MSNNYFENFEIEKCFEIKVPVLVLRASRLPHGGAACHAPGDAYQHPENIIHFYYIMILKIQNNNFRFQEISEGKAGGGADVFVAFEGEFEGAEGQDLSHHLVVIHLKTYGILDIFTDSILNSNLMSKRFQKIQI